MSDPYTDENGNPVIPDVNTPFSNTQLPATVDPSQGFSMVPSMPSIGGGQPAPMPMVAPDYRQDPSVTNYQPLDPNNPQELDKAPEDSGYVPGEKPTFTPPGTPLSPADQADKAVLDASANEADAKYVQHKAEMDAGNALIDRQTQAESEYRNGITKLDQLHQANRAQAEANGDAKVASWLTSQQALADKEPNRGRYWENQTAFGKALWMFSIAATAIGNQRRPGADNMAVKMLMDAVNEDVGDQKDRLARQLKLGEVKGGIIKDQNARRIHDLEDDDSKAFQRYESVRRELMDRAKKTGNPDLIAAAAQRDADLAGAMTNLVQKKRTEMVAADIKTLDYQRDITKTKMTEGYQNYRAGLAQAGEDRRLKSTQDFQEKQKDADRAEKLLLAKATAKASAKQAQSEFDEKNPKIDRSSGVSVWTPPSVDNPSGAKFLDNLLGKVGIEGPDGNVYGGTSDLHVSKEEHDKAGEALANYTRSAHMYKQLEEASKKAGGIDFLLNNDADFNSKLARSTLALGVTQQGHHMSDKDVPLTQAEILGIPVAGVVNRIKSMSNPAERTRLIHQGMLQLTKDAEAEFNARWSDRIPAGSKIRINFPDLDVSGNTTPSTESIESKYAIPKESTDPWDTAKSQPKQGMEVTKENYDKLESAGVLPPLPTNPSSKLGGASLREFVDNAGLDMQNGDKAHVDAVTKGANYKLDKYAEDNPGQAKQVAQARLALEASAKPAYENAAHLQEAVSEIIQNTAMESPWAAAKGEARITGPELRTKLIDNHITGIDGNRFVKLLDDVNKALAKPAEDEKARLAKPWRKPN